MNWEYLQNFISLDGKVAIVTGASRPKVRRRARVGAIGCQRGDQRFRRIRERNVGRMLRAEIHRTFGQRRCRNKAFRWGGHRRVGGFVQKRGSGAPDRRGNREFRSDRYSYK